MDTDQPTCPVCFELVTPNGCFLSDCGHSFHVPCIENWIVQTMKNNGEPKCPTCRATLKNAPGMIAMRANQPPTAVPFVPRFLFQRPVPTNPRDFHARPFEVLQDFPPMNSLSSALLSTAVGDDFCELSHACDVVGVPASVETQCAAIVTLKFKKTTHTIIPVDFVLLIDVSGSMDGYKLNAAKKALNRVSRLFHAGDRVSLVCFDDNARQLTPLAPMCDGIVQRTFQRMVTKLKTGGGTDIFNAMKTAFTILKERRHKNPLCHILVFTDGQDTMSAEDIHRLKQVSDESGSPSWSAFGFGADHDANLLADLSKTGLGSFTFIEERMADEMDETFAAFVSDASSVAACNVTLHLQDPRTNDGESRTILIGNASVGSEMHFDTVLLLRPNGEPAPSRIEAFSATVKCKGFDGVDKTIGPVSVFVDVTNERVDANAETLEKIASIRNATLLTRTTDLIANALQTGTTDDALRIIDTASRNLLGDENARTPVLERLNMMRNDVAVEERETVQRRARQAHASSSVQRAVSHTPYSNLTPSAAAFDAMHRARSMRHQTN